MSKYDVAGQHTPFSLEILEARITPANFFLSPTGAVTDSSGQDVNIASLASEVGTSKAILLKKGDSLIFDANGDGVYDKKTETNLFQVKGGASYLFLDDVIGDDATPLDITGVAATTKFSAIAQTDVLGDIATMTTIQGSGKNATYQFNEAIITDATITGFTSNGKVSGSILAGGSISKINISSGTDALSVQDIRAGTAVGATGIHLGGATPIDVGAVVVAPGAKGASISTVTLAGGAHLIAAGDGGSISDPASKLKGGIGGSLSKITASLNGDISLIAGAGGSASAPAAGGTSKYGGAGGSVSTVSLSSVSAEYDITVVSGAAGAGGKSSGGAIDKLTLAGDALGDVSLSTGDGSSSILYESNSGGDGGSFKFISISANSLASLSLVTGSGGDSLGTNSSKGGDGGDGGSLGNLSLSAILGGLSITTGNGGDASGTFRGGQASSIEDRSFNLADGADVQLTAGDGGAGWKTTGAGGSIRDISLHASSEGSLLGIVTLTAGDGGSSYSLISSDKTTLSVADGGAGGVISDISATGRLAELHATGGNGGNASKYLPSIIDPPSPLDYTVATKRALSGGAGGDIADLTATVTGESFLRAGDAGSSSNMPTSSGKFGDGAAGGSVVNTVLSGFGGANLEISAGKGGGSVAANGFAGNIDGLELNTLEGGFGDVRLISGEGADGLAYGFGQNLTDYGDGGDGGTFSSVRINGAVDTLTIVGGNGGNGGNVFTLAGNIYLSAGGAGASVSGSSFFFNAQIGTFNVTGGNGGSGTKAGAGGDISGWGFYPSIEEIHLTGGDGGSGTQEISKAGSVFDIGFAGGTFSKVSLAGGNGGSGLWLPGVISGNGSNAGEGGDVRNVTADIGATFGELTLTSGDGGSGLADTMNVSGSGRGGDAGTIHDISLVAHVETLSATGGNGGDGQNRSPIFDGGGMGGMGGGIFNFGAGNADIVTINAGNGGMSFGQPAFGPAGGDISNVSLYVTESVQMKGGNGGTINSLGGAVGGFAGKVSDIVLTSAAYGGDGVDVSILGGTGGQSTSATQILGGNVSNISLFKGHFGTVDLKGGTGGEGLLYYVLSFPGSGHGGAGGTVSGVTVDTLAWVDTLNLSGGDGGDSAAVSNGRAGDGGTVSDDALHFRGVINTLSLRGGDGGDGAWGEVASGSGGSLNFSGFAMENPVANLIVAGGNAGHGITAFSELQYQIGGNGGTVTGGIFQFTNSAAISGGNGGSLTGSTANGNGGDGGNVSDVILWQANLLGSSSGAVTIFSGKGGDGYSGAGDGGQITNVDVRGSLTSFEAFGGNGGGQTTNGTANGGNGGNINSLILNAVITEVLLETGDGGNGANGGNAGTFGLSGIQLQAGIGTISLTTGNGGNGSVNGGNGGSINDPFSFPGAEVLAAILTSGNGGNGTTGTGGQGGEITNITSITAINGVETHPGADGTGAI